MEEYEYGYLSDFIGENWVNFVKFMEERDTDKAECEELVNKLDQLAGR